MDDSVYDKDTLEFTSYLFEQLPALPVGNWMTACIFREREEQANREHEAPPRRYELHFTPLKDVASITLWHSSMVDVKLKSLFEILMVERETAAYRKLDGQGVSLKSSLTKRSTVE